jgi:YidC/Oxa1 family membrane protein insertase
MNDQKRFLMAIVLIMAILGIYSLASPPKTKPPKKTHSQTVALQKNTSVESNEQEKEAAKIREDKTIEVKTNYFKAEISTSKAAIKKLWIKSPTDNSFSVEPLLLTEDMDTETLEIEIINSDEKIGDYGIVESSENEVVLLAKTSSGLEVKKRFIFSNSNYDIQLYITIKNKSENDKIIAYNLTAANNLQFSSVLDKRFLNAGSYSGKDLVWVKPKEAIKAAKEGKVYSFASDPKWAVLRNTHSSVIIKPYQTIGYTYLSWEKGSSKLQENWSLGLSADSIILSPEKELTHQYMLYAGPTTEKNLAPLGLAEAVNYGKLDVVCKLLIKVLTFFYDVTGNYGVAIIFLVIVINIITYPLTYKNVKSMRHMQSVQPHMAKLRETHKDDQKKLQAEMMRLYRENNVNPMGGCLPMLLQMPIFISLYVTLARTPMLKGSKFLWIKDLSLPDALFLFSKTLPVVGDSFNLLPILMMVAMVVQQKISMSARSGSGEKSPQEEQQQKMMIMMPIVFGFIFYSLPSGLVLYWTVNTTLMAVAHFIIQKQLDKTTAVVV